jgi:hypothetical protein
MAGDGSRTITSAKAICAICEIWDQARSMLSAYTGPDRNEFLVPA